ncbi:MAG: amidohydrolase family protein [Candidatus Eremiobacteraeota bacterium]|nr:amidohydrolase family protein [Candidatus Eremiobacteraeota bacterium]
MTTAFVNAQVTTLDPASPRAAGIICAGGVIERLLFDEPVGLARDVRVVDCAGAAIVPGLHDCHMHLTDTGLLAGDHDMRGCADVEAMLRRTQMLCAGRSRTEPLYAGNYDEANIVQGRPPKRAELDAVSGGIPVVLTRVDGHSCAANSAAFALLRLEGLDGVERDASGAPTGLLRAAANYAAQNGIIEKLSAASKRMADERAAEIALRAGITTAHHVIVVDEPFEALREHYRRDESLPIRVIPKTCSTDVGKVKKLGRRVFGGDIYVDGSIGSRTAALTSGYHDGAGSGFLYLRADQLHELFDEAAEQGLSLGVHAIGDRAIEQAITAWEAVIAKRGPLDGVRPSIDHFEIASDDQIGRAARAGILLSIQPAFDLLWGGADGMYERRLGAPVAQMMNRFRTARRAGCTICAGSDSPITPLSALLGIRALTDHHIAAERCSMEEALRAYTTDAAALSFDEGRRGMLAPGYDADFVLLEQPLDAVEVDAIDRVRVLMTVIAGEIRFSQM